MKPADVIIVFEWYLRYLRQNPAAPLKGPACSSDVLSTVAALLTCATTDTPIGPPPPFTA